MAQRTINSRTHNSKRFNTSKQIKTSILWSASRLFGFESNSKCFKSPLGLKTSNSLRSWDLIAHRYYEYRHQNFNRQLHSPGLKYCFENMIFTLGCSRTGTNTFTETRIGFSRYMSTYFGSIPRRLSHSLSFLNFYCTKW